MCWFGVVDEDVYDAVTGVKKTNIVSQNIKTKGKKNKMKDVKSNMSVSNSYKWNSHLLKTL